MITAVINNPDIVKATITSPNQPTVSSVGIGLQNFQLNNITDLDLTSLTNGSVLVYKSSNSKWTATTLLDSQNVEAGEF